MAIFDVRLHRPQRPKASRANMIDRLGVAVREPGLGSYERATTPTMIATTPNACIEESVSDSRTSAPSTVNAGYAADIVPAIATWPSIIDSKKQRKPTTPTTHEPRAKAPSARVMGTSSRQSRKAQAYITLSTTAISSAILATPILGVLSFAKMPAEPQNRTVTDARTNQSSMIYCPGLSICPDRPRT